MRAPRHIPLCAAMLLGGMAWFVRPVTADTTPSASLDGYLKNYSVAFHIPAELRLGSTPSLLGSISNRGRLNFQGRLSSRVRFEASYDIRARVEDPAVRIQDAYRAATGPLVYRVDDLDLRLYPNSNDSLASLVILQNLDRLQLVWSPDPFDLYLGRQPIAWGAARVVNPVDVLAPFQYSDLDIEDRVGIDAVRLRVPVGNLNEIDAGYVPGRDFDFDYAAVFLRTRVYLNPQDVSLIALAFRRHLLVGFDVTQPVGGAGTWLEAAYAWMNTFKPDAASTGPDYLRLSAGADYNFGGDVYGYLEYHFNGAGTRHAENYVSLPGSTPYREAAVYLLGRHYITPGMLWTLSPLWSLRANALTNLQDPSLFLSASAEYNIAENVYLEGGAFLGLGRHPDVTIQPALPPRIHIKFGSEFGSYSDFYYLSFRCYF